MPKKINWKAVPGLTIEVIDELLKLPIAIAKKAFEALSSREGSLANITADQIRAYRSTDQGDASTFAVERQVEGRVAPTVQTDRQTFAGTPVRQETIDELTSTGSPVSFATGTAVASDKKETNVVENIDFATIHKNQYGSDYNTDARIQSVFRTKDGFMNDSLISDLGPKMLKEKYFAATGGQFSGSDKDLVKTIKELRDKALSSQSN